MRSLNPAAFIIGEFTKVETVLKDTTYRIFCKEISAPITGGSIARVIEDIRNLAITLAISGRAKSK